MEEHEDLIGYRWADSPRARESYPHDLQRMSQMRYWRDAPAEQRYTCNASLFFDNRDPFISEAQLFLGIDIALEYEGLIYDGPFRETVTLFLPQQPPDWRYLNIWARAFVDSKQTYSYWVSLDGYDFTCDGPPINIHFLNYNHMDYGGSTLVVLREDRGL